MFLKQKEKYMELSGCEFNSTTERAGVKGTVGEYQSCECIYRDPYLGWSDRSVRMKEKSSCRRSIPDMYNNSRCVDGSVKTHYYLTCGDVLYTE